MSATSEGVNLVWSDLTLSSCLNYTLKTSLDTDTEISEKLSLHAPLTALGLSSKNDYSYKNTINKPRMRKQVGFTNRWRLPEPLGSDILGTSQALRAISTQLNETLIKVITAEGPQLSASLDLSQPYKFRQINDRPTSSLIYNLGSKKKSQIFSQPKREFSAQNIFGFSTMRSNTKPDISLQCLGVKWNLHSKYINKSPVLVDLFLKVYESNKSTLNLKQTMFRKKKSASDSQLKLIKSPLLEKPLKLEGFRRNSIDSVPTFDNLTSNEMYHINLAADDPKLTRKGLAMALNALYQDVMELPFSKQIVHVLAAAHLLQMKDLSDRCVETMFETVTAETIATFYDAALRHKLHDCVTFCEHWIELHLIPTISKTIHLRDVPRKLFELFLFSERLFTENEFSVYQTICYWVYFHLNPDCQCFPFSFSTVITYFNGLTKQQSFLESDEGQEYYYMFSAVRFHGITDATHLHQIQTMNIVPQRQIVDVLSHHFDSLYCGGDMFSISEFELASVRWGVIIEDREVYDSEAVFLYGFYFNLKVKKIGSTFHIYIQRVRPLDSTLPFQECERHIFSLRAERPANYSITVTSLHHGLPHTYTTGELTHTFRMEEKHSQSQELVIMEPYLPMFAMFAILFPRS